MRQDTVKVGNEVEVHFQAVSSSFVDQVRDWLQAPAAVLEEKESALLSDRWLSQSECSEGQKRLFLYCRKSKQDAMGYDQYLDCYDGRDITSPSVKLVNS